MNIGFFELIGIATCSAGFLIVCFLADCKIAEVRERASFMRSELRMRELHLSLGWNSGCPPEGARVLVSEYVSDSFIEHLKRDIVLDGLAIMTRHGDRMITDGGSSIPVSRITGWLQIVEPHEGVNGDE